MKKLFLAISVTSLLFSCGGEEESSNEKFDEKGGVSAVKDEYLVTVTELTDKDYPDNPDIGYRSNASFEYSHPKLKITKQDAGVYTLTFLPGNEKSDTIIFPKVDLSVYMPNVPKWVKRDKYLTFLGILNQEWNRQQIRYDDGLGYYELKGSGDERANRIDIARNCLNSGLWEISAYREEDGKTVPYYHGWFDFPVEGGLYPHLFEKETGLQWADYQKGLVDWVTPERKKVDLSVLRTIKSTHVVSYENLNDQYYPLTGARLKKNKNIITPEPSTVRNIQDFLNDETKFATFSPPGFYNTADPRETKLSLLAQLQRLTVSVVESPAKVDETLYEFQLFFKNTEGDRENDLVIGGVSLDQLPVLSIEDNNDGFKMPMGIANHPFYEKYADACANPVKNNPYYAFVLDKDGVWQDSHSLGIDGPIMFFDDEDESKLHIFILAFERHAFVGHYVVDVSEVPRTM